MRVREDKMTRLKMLMTAAALAAPMLMSAPASATCAASTTFAGRWMGNDGGRYVIVQNGIRVNWTGRSADNGRTWTHRFSGSIVAPGVVLGTWQDIAPGRMRQSGTLRVRLQNGVITRMSQTGGFGGSRWTKPCDDVILNPVD